MSKIHKVKDFEYDLWTTHDGKCFARIRATGQKCEINIETMKALRCCEKRIYREQQLFSSLEAENARVKDKASARYPLSLDVINDDENNDASSAWLVSNTDIEEELSTRDLENQFVNTLTDYQQEAFNCVMKNGESQESFALRRNITARGVRRIIEKIQNKAKVFFD